MSRELRELRKINRQLRKNNRETVNPVIDKAGNSIIKAILMGGIILIIIIAIVLWMIMYL